MGKRYGNTDPAVYINRDVIRRVTSLEKALIRAEVRIRNLRKEVFEIHEKYLLIPRAKPDSMLDRE